MRRVTESQIPQKSLIGALDVNREPLSLHVEEHHCVSQQLNLFDL